MHLLLSQCILALYEEYPFSVKTTLHCFIELNEGKMTVGKIYVGLLITENWKAYKASQTNGQSAKVVSFLWFVLFFH